MQRTLSILIAMNLCVALANAQPATTQTEREPLKATITGVEGMVQVRDNETAPWRKATVDMVLNEDAEFRTGPKSAVRFTIPPNQTVTLDRLGTVKLLTVAREGGKIKTNLGMKYGRTRYDIEAAGQEHESSISSPSSTLAVRGTDVSLYDQRPFRAEAVSLTGRADFREGKKQLAFGGKNAGKTKVAQGDSVVSSVALAESFIDPNLQFARSGSETSIVSNLVSRGATFSFDRTQNIGVLFGGTHPLTDQELIPTLPGQLNFVLRWDANVDLNLIVSNSVGNRGGEVLFPASGLNRTLSGGRIDFDHRGGPNGGIEIAYWGGKIAPGSYGIGVLLPAGASDTAATVDVFQGGQRIGIFDGSGIVPTANVVVTPPIPGIAEGTLVGTVQVPGTVVSAPQTALAPKPKPATTPRQPLNRQPVTRTRAR
jgi:hypothetical protein